MILENMQNKNVTEDHILYDSTYIKYSEQANLQRQEVNQWLSTAGLGWRTHGVVIAKAFRVSFWDDENVKLDYGVSCTTL